MIDMFNPVRDLISESDRRTALLEDGEETVFTEEYVFQISCLRVTYCSYICLTVTTVFFEHMRNLVTRCQA
jgi:hypothetical protein